MIRRIASDFAGLVRVCGWGVALRWMLTVVRSARACLRQRNLQSADRLMGEGPFKCRLGSAQAILVGEQVVSGIREIWVRDAYLDGGFLRIESHATVVDLGANMGNFTALALGHGPDVSVVAVEPSHAMCAKLRRTIEVNRAPDRAQICQAFLGSRTRAQDQLEASEAAGVPFLDQAEFVRQYDLSRIDLLKCDIEGSEFGLLVPGTPLLDRTRQLAVELHDFAGDSVQFIQMLRDEGFEVAVRRGNPECCIVLARMPLSQNPHQRCGGESIQ